MQTIPLLMQHYSIAYFKCFHCSCSMMSHEIKHVFYLGKPSQNWLENPFSLFLYASCTTIALRYFEKLNILLVVATQTNYIRKIYFFPRNSECCIFSLRCKARDICSCKWLQFPAIDYQKSWEERFFYKLLFLTNCLSSVSFDVCWRHAAGWC